MAHEIKLSDFKGVWRRRKKLLLISFALLFGAGLIVAFLLPPIYRSQVMIIVENQEIPEEYVRSTTTTYVSERLRVLEQAILSYPNLLNIAQAHALYPNEQSNSKVVALMRGDTTLENVDVSIQDARLGRGGGMATIAFNLAYQHKDPQKAALVADFLANLFVEKDRLSREGRAGTTTAFLEKELEDLRRQVKENEERISRFRAANINQLPGSTNLFLQTVFRLDQEIVNIESRIRNLNEKLVYLRSQIANIDPLVPILTEGGKVAANPANRLKYLRLQLFQLQANLSDRHPDIVRLKSEIAKLEAQVGQLDTTSEMRNRLQLLEKEIAEARSQYGARHPDVLRLSREADFLKEQISQQESAANVTATHEELSDNPGYMNIRAQIIVTESEVEALREQRVRATQQLADYQRRLEMAPFIDEQYNALTLDYENARSKFNEVSNKLHTARIAQELDLSEQGERFRINHSAIVPDNPFKPNRILIILMGFVLGTGCAVVLAALTEALDSSIKASDDIESLLGVPVLTTISMYDSPVHKRQRWIKRIALMTSVIVLVVVGSLAVDRFVVPLSDVWATVEGRLVEMGIPIDKPTAKS